MCAMMGQKTPNFGVSVGQSAPMRLGPEKGKIAVPGAFQAELPRLIFACPTSAFPSWPRLLLLDASTFEWRAYLRLYSMRKSRYLVISIRNINSMASPFLRAKTMCCPRLYVIGSKKNRLFSPLNDCKMSELLWESNGIPTISKNFSNNSLWFFPCFSTNLGGSLIY